MLLIVRFTNEKTLYQRLTATLLRVNFTIGIVAIVTFRGRCRISAISKTKLLVTIVNGFHLLTILSQVQELHPRCGTDPRFASEFSEI